MDVYGYYLLGNISLQGPRVQVAGYSQSLNVQTLENRITKLTAIVY